MAYEDGYKIRDQYGMYFLTFTIVGWIDLFTRKECKDILIDSMKYCIKKKGLVVHAFVIMPSHIHVIWSCLDEGIGMSGIVRDFKKYTAVQLIAWIKDNKKESRSDWLDVVFKYHAKYNPNNSKFQVWIQNNMPMELLHPKFIRQKLDYLHNNPVLAGIVDEPNHYSYSSALQYCDHTMISQLRVELLNFGVEEGYVFT